MDGQQQHMACSIPFLMSIWKRSAIYVSKGEREHLRTHSAASFREARCPSLVDDPCSFSLINVVPQPPPKYEPFNFPLAQYVWSPPILNRWGTALESSTTTDYPNSHKLIWCSLQYLNSKKTKSKLALFIRQKSNWIEFVRHRLNELHRDSVVST